MNKFYVHYNDCMNELELAYNEIMEALSSLRAMTDHDKMIIASEYTRWDYRMTYIGGYNKFLGYLNMIRNCKKKHLQINSKYKEYQSFTEAFKYYSQVASNSSYEPEYWS